MMENNIIYYKFIKSLLLDENNRPKIEFYYRGAYISTITQDEALRRFHLNKKQLTTILKNKILIINF